MTYHQRSLLSMPITALRNLGVVHKRTLLTNQVKETRLKPNVGRHHPITKGVITQHPQKSAEYGLHTGGNTVWPIGNIHIQSNKLIITNLSFYICAFIYAFLIVT